jgi:hypothetical protein
MVIRVPTPSDVFGLAKQTVGWAVDSAAAVAAAPSRVLGLIDEAEVLVSRVRAVVDRADELIERTTRTVEDAEGTIRDARAVADAAADAVANAGRIAADAGVLVDRSGGVCDDASKVVAEAQAATTTAGGLLEVYAPTAKRAAPLLDRFVGELSDAEVDAAIRLVDELPVLTEHILTDVLPILRTLDRVGPEIHELLEVTHDVRRAIVGIPGFQFFRRRGEERVSEEVVAKPEAAATAARD